MKKMAISLGASTRRFMREESGAVTIDWVVLTATLCGVVLALFTFLTDELYENAGMRIAQDVSQASAR